MYIWNLGGQVIQQECDNYIRLRGELMEGQVYTSSAGQLQCKKVIHAVGPRWRGGRAQEERTLVTCIESCFEEAETYQFQSIAIPPISTGIFGYPLDKAVKTIVDALGDREIRKESLPGLVIFVDNKEDSLQLFERELRARYEKTQPKAKPKLPARQQSQTARSPQPVSVG